MSEEPNESESKIKIEIDLKRRIFGGRRRRRLQEHRRRFVNEWLMMFSITVALLIPEFRGVFASFEEWAFDSYLRWPTLQRHESKSPDVVVLDIDDIAYRNCFHGSSPLQRDLVIELVQTVVSISPSPKMLVVDLVTDDKAYGGKSVDSEPPIVWAASASSNPEEEAIWDWLLGREQTRLDRVVALGKPILPGTSDFSWGVPAYPLDEDRRLRRLPSYYGDAAHPLSTLKFPTLSTQAAIELAPEELKYSRSHEVFLTVGTRKKHVSAAQFLCNVEKSDENKGLSWRAQVFQEKPLDPSVFADSIVILGGTYEESRDFHPTSFGEMPGVVMNANAIQAEFNGDYLWAPPRGLTFLLDLAIGTAVIVLLRRYPPKTIRWLIFWNIFAIVGLYLVAGAVLRWRNWMWLSWTGALISSTCVFLLSEFRFNRRISE